MKKLLSVLLAVVIMLSVFSSAVQAVSVGTEDNIPISFVSRSDSSIAFLKSIITDYDGFLSYMRSEMKNGNTSINVSSYNIPYQSDASAHISYLMHYILTDTYYFDTFSYSYSSGKITRIKLNSGFSSGQIVNLLQAMQTEINNITSGLTSLSDTEKALVLHDRLIQRCVYEQNKLPNGEYEQIAHTCYASLVLHSAVCSGYAAAYKSLLDKIGIQNYIVTSDELKHAWNVVIINGKKYHVDCTWDGDNTRLPYGRVNHRNFLRSTSGIISTGHNSDDFDSSPTDTTYDSGWFWSDYSTAAVQCINGTLYMPKYDSADRATYLMTVKNLQFADKICKINGGYNKTASDGTYYYYNISDEIRKVDVSTGSTITIYTNDDYIAGFRILDNKMDIDIGYTSTYSTEYRSTTQVTLDFPVRYTVSFYGLSASKSLEPGQAFGTLPVPEQEGFRFIGWSDKDGNTVTSETIFTVAEDITLYADWKEIIRLNDGAPAELDTDNNLLILSTVCDVTTLFKNKNVSFNGQVVTGACVTVADETLTIALLGDIDCDGLIDGRDAVISACIVHGALDALELSEAQMTAADYNKDNVIDAKDFRILRTLGIAADEDYKTIPNELGIDYAFYVPETVYLAPAEDASLFRYYVDNEKFDDGLSLRTGENTRGNILFVNQDADSIDAITCDGADVSFSKQSSDTFYIETEILGGQLTESVKPNKTCVITWEVRYTSGGVKHTAKAYTTCYAPLAGVGSSIAAGGFAETKKIYFPGCILL